MNPPTGWSFHDSVTTHQRHLAGDQASSPCICEGPFKLKLEGHVIPETGPGTWNCLENQKLKRGSPKGAEKLDFKAGARAWGAGSVSRLLARQTQDPGSHPQLPREAECRSVQLVVSTVLGGRDRQTLGICQPSDTSKLQVQ